MGTVALKYNGLWAEADLRGDADATGREIVHARWQEDDLKVDDARIDVLGNVIALAIRSFQEQDPPPVFAMLLYPDAEEPIVTAVAIRHEPVDEVTDLDEIAAQILLPPQMLEQPALTEFVETAGGPALHIVQRHLSPVAPGVEEVEEHEIFAWCLDDGDGPAVVTLSTTYLDPATAAEWREDLAELARGLVVQPDDA
jgi:hypothetical protein